MGEFSWLCRGCGHGITSNRSVQKGDVNYWLCEAVLVFKFGNPVIGKYDGYGRIDDYEIDTDDPQDPNNVLDPCLWHQACWEMAGRPTDFVPSRRDPDQGWLHWEGAHEAPDPRLEEKSDG